MQQERRDVVWQQPAIAAGYLEARRGIPFADAHFEIADRIIQAHGLDVRRVLDLGAGDGLAVAALIERHPVERAVLVDFSEPMLAEARARLGGVDAPSTSFAAISETANGDRLPKPPALSN